MKALFLTWSLVASLGLAAAGCASGAPEPRGPGQADQYVTLLARGVSRQAKLEGNEFYGQQIRLSFYEDGVRGVVDEQVASFSEREGGRVVGTFGGQPVDLRVGEGVEGFTVRGLFGGQLSNLRLDREGVKGSVGRCGYELRPLPEPGVLVGRRACRDLPEDVTLALPPAFASRSPAERAVVLVTVLGGAAALPGGRGRY